jgi:ABC-type multidrug transport system fused ATPase/permease subunit
LIVLGLIILFAIQFVAAYYQNLTLMKLSQYSMRDLRVELFARILSYEVNYFDTNPLGRLVNRITNDIEVLNEMFSSVLVSLFQDILLLTGIAIIMFREDVYLASAVAITFPVLIFITWLFRIKSAEKYRKIREITARLNAFLSETISGIRIIQLFVAEVKNLRKFHGVNSELYRENMGQMYVFAIFRPLIDFIKWFCVASVLYFGAQGIVHHAISWGVIVLFMQYIASFFDPISDLSEKFDIMISANAAGEKILTVIKARGRRERRVIDEDGNQRVSRDGLTKKNAASLDQKRFGGAVELRNVWFGYKKDEWVLKDLCLQVKPRQTIAIVGETGAGKSTIISLLSRLYDIQKGDITIDGMHIKNIPYELLRRNIAIVMQDVFLFSRTVRENIILNAPYDEERFRFVCAITHVDQFIKKLPQGDLEPVMERGVTFSSGERQLISFARALYFDPAILVLDEATSNIDSETEKLIQDAISHLIENRTSILIAHRLSTVRNADQIVVLEKGRIVETGKHSELIRKRGIYYNLYRIQFQEH